MKTIIEVKRAKSGDYFWHAKRGSRIVCDSGEGYKRKAALCRTLARFLTSIKEGNFEIKGLK